jgi:hypothetical protein
MSNGGLFLGHHVCKALSLTFFVRRFSAVCISIPGAGSRKAKIQRDVLDLDLPDAGHDRRVCQFGS